MANDEHLALLRQGSAVWNEWRERNPGVMSDLEGANLRCANLQDADIREAVLSEADLSGTAIREADFSGADLREAGLAGADLTRTNLTEADLSGADLSGTNLSEVNLSRANVRGAKLHDAFFFETILGNLDLAEAAGLNNCRHIGPSSIDVRTLVKSENLPISFLRGVGLANNLIDYLPSLRGNAIEFYSCFISYSSKGSDVRR